MPSLKPYHPHFKLSPSPILWCALSAFVSLLQGAVCLHRLYGVGVVKMIQLDELGEVCPPIEVNARIRQGVALALLHLTTAYRMDGGWSGMCLVGSSFHGIIMLDDLHAVVETSPPACFCPAFQGLATYFQSHNYSSLGRNLLAVGQISSDNPCNINPEPYRSFTDFYRVLFSVIRHSIVEQALSPLDKSPTMHELFGDILKDVLEMPQKSPDTQQETKEIVTKSLAKGQKSMAKSSSSREGGSDDEIHRAETRESSLGGSGFWTKEAVEQLTQHLRDKVASSAARWQQAVAESWHPYSCDELFQAEVSARQDLWLGPPECCHGQDPYDIIVALDIRILPVGVETFERFVSRRMEQAGIFYSDVSV
ncbi:hypothetical protein IAR50_004048 [Cryptococcus sp. DSM 104548]